MLAKFRNSYHCPNCGHDWTDDWDCTPDDDCPKCGTRHISPYQSADLIAVSPDTDQSAPDTDQSAPDQSALADFGRDVVTILDDQLEWSADTFDDITLAAERHGLLSQDGEWAVEAMTPDTDQGAPDTDNTPDVIVLVEGGCVQSIKANRADLHIYVLDLDEKLDELDPDEEDIAEELTFREGMQAAFEALPCYVW